MSNITPVTFVYASNFPTLSSTAIQAGIDYIEATFSGIFSLWSVLPATAQQAKYTALENLLVAWYLMDIYPRSVVGVTGSGGQVIVSKKVGGRDGVEIKYNSSKSSGSSSELINLTTNAFGEKALLMINSVPERFKIYG
jgi:hypothetical protein